MGAAIGAIAITTNSSDSVRGRLFAVIPVPHDRARSGDAAAEPPKACRNRNPISTSIDVAQRAANARGHKNGQPGVQDRLAAEPIGQRPPHDGRDAAKPKRKALSVCWTRPESVSKSCASAGNAGRYMSTDIGAEADNAAKVSSSARPLGCFYYSMGGADVVN